MAATSVFVSMALASCDVYRTCVNKICVGSRSGPSRDNVCVDLRRASAMPVMGTAPAQHELQVSPSSLAGQCDKLSQYAPQRAGKPLETGDEAG